MAIPPPWPRPVSPLQYESLAPEPQHEIFLDDSSSDEDEVSRIAKRRRIEQLGQRYLRGYGLEISTARIRGPLGEGWKNPWRRNKRRSALGQGTRDNKMSLSKEVPETVQRTEPALATNVQKGNQQLQRLESNPKSHEVSEDRPIAQAELPPKLSPHVQQEAIEDDPFISTNTVKSKAKVEHWLKRDQRIMRSRLAKEFEGPQSPTARFTAINTMRTGLSQVANQPLADLTTPPKNQNQNPDQEATPKELASSFQPKISVRDLHPHLVDTRSEAQDDTTEARIGPTVQAVEVVIPSVQALDNDTGDQSNRNAETSNPDKKALSRRNGVVKIRAKRRSLQAVPPSTNLSEFEFRRVARNNDEKAVQLDERANALISSKAHSQRKIFVASGTDIDQPHDTGNHTPAHTHETANGKKHDPSSKGSEPPVDGRGSGSISSFHSLTRDPSLQNGRVLLTANKDADEKMKPPPPPSLSTETSNKTDTTITNNLPSAQIMPYPQGPVMPNSLLSTKLDSGSKANNGPQAIEEEHIEDSILFLSTQAAVERAQKKFQAELETPKPHTTTVLQQGGPDTVKDHMAESVGTSTDASKLSPSYHTPDDLNTQAMIDAISPFDFSTTKKVPLKAADSPKCRPTTATKAHPTKNKKRASFALDAQDTDGTVQSSIRTALKVTKRVAAGEGPTEAHRKSFTDDSIHFSSADGSPKLDMSTSTEASAVANRSNVTKAATSSLPNLSSLLHPAPRIDTAEHAFPTASSTDARFTTPAAPTTANPTPSSTRLQQDAQPEAHQHHLPAATNDNTPSIAKEIDNGGDVIDSFDLEATMDDIGSFLQSWDAEKEAKDQVVHSASGSGGESADASASGSTSRRDWKRGSGRWAAKGKGVRTQN
ncbi:MAG: hypothetical protein Q9160_000573 [Pyrenula sp. 1 TL-2023]